MTPCDSRPAAIVSVHCFSTGIWSLIEIIATFLPDAAEASNASPGYANVKEAASAASYDAFAVAKPSAAAGALAASVGAASSSDELEQPLKTSPAASAAATKP